MIRVKQVKRDGPISNILMAMTSHDKWYQKIDGTQDPLV
jgi:hypothetical protein